MTSISQKANNKWKSTNLNARLPAPNIVIFVLQTLWNSQYSSFSYFSPSPILLVPYTKVNRLNLGSYFFGAKFISYLAFTCFSSSISKVFQAKFSLFS